jgi:ABC-type oligopeptide transport system substrate-binding subunit
MQLIPGSRLLLAALAAVSAVLTAALLWRGEPARPPGLVFRLESFAIRLDPNFIADTQSRRVIDLLHAKLVRSAPTEDFTGEIARSWSWTTPTTLRVELREGLTFSNGQPVTAADAAFSICRTLQPGSPYGWLFANVRHAPGRDGEPTECPGLRAYGQFSLEIEVTEDPSRLLPALATTSASIVPALSVPGDYGQVPGAGPYVVEQIVPGSRVVLRSRSGGAIEPGAERVTFQLLDDPTAANLFRAGRLDALEISNPTLYRLLVRPDGQLDVPGRLISSEPHQIRLVIFNRAMIAQSLGVEEPQAAAWVAAFRASIDVEALAQRFSPLLIPMHTAYFPARDLVARVHRTAEMPPLRGRITIVTENDPFSDAIAAALARRVAGVELSYVGFEKSVMVSRLINRQYDIIALTLEAVANHPSYWLSFFTPGSAFTLFGEAIEGLDLSHDAPAARRNAEMVDRHGNWLVLARERRFVALQPRIGGEAFHATGLLNYANMGVIR